MPLVRHVRAPSASPRDLYIPSMHNRPPLKPGKVSPKLPVPAHIRKPPYADRGDFPPWADRSQVHGEEGKRRMRASGRLAARVLEFAGSLVRPGVTTDEIDKAVHAMIIENGAYPSPLNYGKFPKSVCTSVNECVCHGIPDDRPLEAGDIVNIDVTVFLDGYHGDTSRMFFVEWEASGPLYHINIADKHKYGVIRDYVGHGVGQSFHSHPTIFHYKNSQPGVMQLGETFTIEPMIVQGATKCDTWRDNWTVVTKDRGLAAQFEHTLLITEGGAEILTKLE
ncbi:hypothetical protein VOLCADRAFT_102436 [Volvox carteri f. nagariensis]|uniref:Peptidase M24 domain-containing protein n=1 Tax=Volvox carteri f. nagariensis TaxID=3068 RepID=D8UG33_VOLCA|nr:uncharacterized protein VOLCADRAFT_102436 [Volvox carteri f. nagariensis]EFJ41280.1 hypothetical protein VOLCADRAFT_102436 [Volvox carteri f. nagariensis]|eukprot:XP_002957614.1 hypothetical protein VOLCADRAFT_102436 [Volvox carteri f. nagariensis]